MTITPSSIIDLSTIISTLIINGFSIKKFERFIQKNYIFDVYKYDKLGAEIRYSIWFTNDIEETPLVDSLLAISTSYNSTPLIICDNNITSKCRIISFEDFFDLFGGIVNTGLILLPDLPAVLRQLGLNKLPDGLSGSPDDLLELYAKECLQFILESPVRRYGKERSFESLPDGLVIGKNRFMILYDSKAYSLKQNFNGFAFEADDIKRFASYVDDFNRRYSSYLGRVFSFVVITGNFHDSVKSISSRSDELYRLCNCKMSCITSEELGKIVQFLLKYPSTRSSIVWENIFTKLIVSVEEVSKEVKRIERDLVI
jgi:hypothetical protein